MITILVEIKVRDGVDDHSSENRYFVRHYEDLPWPRLPNQGETLYMNAPDIFLQTDVFIETVTFHPSNGHVTLELKPEEITADLLDCLYELYVLGFAETDDPFTEFEGQPSSNSTSTSDDHQCPYREALEQINNLDPKNFQRGQEHLGPAFREPDIRAAFREVICIVNKTLHDTDEFGRPLR